ncbi:unnamed protein product, partial [Discosporangium mesarthrocarpum]
MEDGSSQDGEVKLSKQERKRQRKALKKAQKLEKVSNGVDKDKVRGEEEAAAVSKKAKKKKKKGKKVAEGEKDGGNEDDAEQQRSSTTDAGVVGAVVSAGSEGDEGEGKKKGKKRKKDKGTKTSQAEDSVEAGEVENGGKAKKRAKKDKKRSTTATIAPPPSGSATPMAVTVDGMDVTPLADFASANMPSEVMKYVTDRGWKAPTPIQGHCWPVLLAGRDIVGIAETGSGKTLAFSLPAMSAIFKKMAAAEKKGKLMGLGPFMLVLAPTRELALQSAEVITEAGQHCNIRCTCIYGGVPKRDQRAALGVNGGKHKGGAGGVHAVVATPGRLKDLVGEGACDLSQVTSLVLDEADRMLDLGFEQDVREIISWCAPKRQTAMFSATWPNSIRDLASEFLTNPIKVTVGADSLAANVRVAQHVEVVEERERDSKLLALLRVCHKSRTNRVLVFALYKREAARLEQFLQRGGFDAVAVHGDKSQADRERALSQFKSKGRPLMVATDVAARGLDIPDVEYVINYSFPLTIEDYIHRIGRTGRAGKNGVSHTFFHQGDKARAGELVNVLQ